MAVFPAVMSQPVPGAIPARQWSRPWSTDICDCCQDMEICCYGFWCPCCFMCRTSSEFGECLCLPLLDCVFGEAVRPISLAMRSAVRERYNIQGNVCSDCFITSCCPVCVWCQIARELKRHRTTLIMTPPAPFSPEQCAPYPPPQHMQAGQFPKVP